MTDRGTTRTRQARRSVSVCFFSAKNLDQNAGTILSAGTPAVRGFRSLLVLVFPRVSLLFDLVPGTNLARGPDFFPELTWVGRYSSAKEFVHGSTLVCRGVPARSGCFPPLL